MTKYHEGQLYTDALSAAASLFDPQDCIAGFGDYTRGICEVIARTFPKIGIATDERAEEVMTDVQSMVTEGRCYER